MLEVEKKNQYSFTDVQINSNSELIAVSDPSITYLYKLEVNEEGLLKLTREKQSLPGAKKLWFYKSTLFLITMTNEVLSVSTAGGIKITKLKESDDNLALIVSLN